jgi:hypothetical protein
MVLQILRLHIFLKNLRTNIKIKKSHIFEASKPIKSFLETWPIYSFDACLRCRLCRRRRSRSSLGAVQLSPPSCCCGGFLSSSHIPSLTSPCTPTLGRFISVPRWHGPLPKNRDFVPGRFFICTGYFCLGTNEHICTEYFCLGTNEGICTCWSHHPVQMSPHRGASGPPPPNSVPGKKKTQYKYHSIDPTGT